MKHIGHFLLSAVIVLCSVIVLDIAAGKVLNRMLPQVSPQTAIGKTYFALNEVNTPVVIVGSSRASHHYISQMIEDSLGKDTYNVGRDGCFFSDNICVINSILDRYCPEIIIWELSSSSLYESNDDPLDNLYPYYNENLWITEMINLKEDRTIRLCLKSHLYKNNSKILRICMRLLTNSGELDPDKGYEPLIPRNWIAASKTDTSTQENKIDLLKMKMLKNIVERAKKAGAELIVVDSPIYSERCNIESLPNNNPIQEILSENDIRYLDNRYIDKFVLHSEYFNDRTHLNSVGAEVYTTYFLEEIKNLY